MDALGAQSHLQVAELQDWVAVPLLQPIGELGSAGRKNNAGHQELDSNASFCSDRIFYAFLHNVFGDINDWISLKINDVPPFELYHIIFYMDHPALSVSDTINIIILLGKYHIHCAKWRNTKPSFPAFINDFKLLFSSLKK